jgi:carbon storage regulator CsrA
MLVLSRKENESIIITIPANAKPGDQIVVTVVEAQAGKTRLGFEAPNYIPVHRKEVADAIARGEPKPC